MLVYEQAKYEWYLVHWFNLLSAGGDLKKLFLDSISTLTEFLGLFSQRVLMFDVDNRGIWFAAWVLPFASGALFSLWVRPDKRRSSQALRNVNFCYEQSLKKFRVLIGLTRQPELHEMHLKAGYKFVGSIPQLMDGQDTLVYAMTMQSRSDAKVLPYGRIRQLVHGEAPLERQKPEARN